MHRSIGWMVLAGAVALGACDDGETTAPEQQQAGTLTVDAAQDWAFVGFSGDGAQQVTVSDPAASDAWDIGVFATSVMLNGGAAGPGGVEGYCLCQNAAATDAAVLAMTPASELAAFEAVTAASIPTAAGAWQSDALAPAIAGWYSYDPTTHVVSADPTAVWKVRTASGDAYAKLHVTDVQDATQSHAGTVTLEYALQPSAGAAFGPITTAELDLSAGPVYVDLESGSTVTAADDWDLWLEGWSIRVNGGVSGDGSAGASPATESFAAIMDASDLAANHYRGDAFGGVFDEHRWYRYNLQGGHQVWPTYDVYLIRRGAAVWKVQLTGYYGATGDSRQITLRHERIQ